MKKITILFTSICALTSINSSFGMLTKRARTIAAHRKIQFHTNTTAYSLEKYGFTDTMDSLNKIIEQNKENNHLLKKNNELLRIIITQNHLISQNQLYGENGPSERQDARKKLNAIYEQFKRDNNS